MEAQRQKLVDKVWKTFSRLPSDRRYIIVLAGVPGSGKTTFANQVTSALNARYTGNLPWETLSTSPFLSIGQDGFHLPRSTLHTMPNAEEAVRRRGAPFTFDPRGLLTLIRKLKQPISQYASPSASIFAPTFDHAKKDPVERGVEIPATARVIIIEGNYLLLDADQWRDIASLADERWLIEIDLERATARLVKRHVQTGVEPTEALAKVRAGGSDLDNAQEIIARKVSGIDETIVASDDTVLPT